VKKIGILFAISLLSACASNPSGIGSNVTLCCADKASQTFAVSAVDIPAFLGPLMVSNFSVALAARGLQPVEDDADLDVVLKYVQTNLIQDNAKDDFDESLSPGGDVRFIAKIVVEIKDASSGKMVWSGSIQRTHNVSPGEFMHTGRASISLLDSFLELLVDFNGETE
jgi:hypothetical protein